MQLSNARIIRNVPFLKGLARPVITGPIELVVIQATPFCNLDCSYCYLPDRDVKTTISDNTLEKILQRLDESGLLGETVSFVWHAGEPMVAGMEFYERVFTLISRRMPARTRVRHCFQTNGVLINPAWCALIKKWDVSVGISVDGPDFIHDRYRQTRNGKGTHAAVMAGMATLKRENIGFHTISVLTDYALDYPDEMFHFFYGNEIRHCGFNIEEQERVNERTSLAGENTVERFRRFYKRFYELNRQHHYPLGVREFNNTLKAIKGWDRNQPDQYAHSQELTPYRIVSIDVNGDYSSYSPELLGENTDQYGRFYFGNVRTHSLAQAAATTRFKQVRTDIQKGVRLCRNSCKYYSVCGGGSPSNKYYENGRFDSTDTLFCTLQRKVLVDLLLEELELGGGNEKQAIMNAAQSTAREYIGHGG